jgi:dTDP-4-amino-4,6-dideoxygalactose transaminase
LPESIKWRTRPFPPWPYFDEEQIEAAAAVLRSGRVNYWTGDEGRLFENEFATAVGADYAVAVANGTVALELALYALGIGPGDEVIVPCRTFLATASSVVVRGAVPVFADVDLNSQNVTVETLERVRTPRTRAVIVVHLAGWPCAMDEILSWAQAHDVKIIEDCAQALGASYKERPVGSWGDAAAFSFCQDKILTTGGEGGMLATNSRAVWERAWSFKDHGKSWEAVYNNRQPTVFKWLHASIGTNWRLTEMQSAIGRVALRRLEEWVKTRRRYAGLLDAAFAKQPLLRTAVPPAECEHSYYKYYAFVRPALLQPGYTRDDVVRALQQGGIPCGSGACGEIYREQAFTKLGLAPHASLPTGRELGETALMLLVHPTLTPEDIADTIRAVNRVLESACVGQSRAAA